TAISQLCHRACWIEQGTVRAVGQACDVVQQYSVTVAKVAQGDMNNAVIDGDGSVLPIDYRVSNQQATTTPLPVTNEDIIITVRLKVNNTIEQPAYGIEIHNVQGVRMLTVNTVELGTSPPPLQAGEGEVQFRLKKVPYIPGVYRAGVWVMNPQGHMYMMT